jgi:hypothetical protein
MTLLHDTFRVDSVMMNRNRVEAKDFRFFVAALLRMTLFMGFPRYLTCPSQPIQREELNPPLPLGEGSGVRAR